VKDSDRYLKLVEWSEEDHCYVGSAPGLMLGGCHGDDEEAVFAELCWIVDDVIAGYRNEGKPLPAPTAGRRLAERLAGLPELR
jgi:predicted RNase H-like HicB family nuclease